MLKPTRHHHSLAIVRGFFVYREMKMSENKVTKEQIDAIMVDVTHHVYRVPDTTTTIAVAFDKDGFSLGVGMSACVDPANFNEELGNQYACGCRKKPLPSYGNWKAIAWQSH